ncbi:hypothetical protein [Anaerosporobacter faecicola]|nr:hypothetical protein [Anaerosporobacter faecicola]
MKNQEEPKTIHDSECSSCKRLFICNGKPVDVKRCINYKEMKGKNDGYV